jgi:hypothetical protein
MTRASAYRRSTSPYGLGSATTGARHPNGSIRQTQPSTTTDAKWGHFKPSRRGQRKPSFSPWSASHRAQKILVILHGVTARPRREAWIATNQREKAPTVTVKPSDDFDQSEPWSAASVASCGNVSPVIDPWPC